MGQEQDLTAYNEKVIRDGTYSSVDDLQRKLEKCKVTFIDFDANGAGEITVPDLKLAMDKYGQPKSHTEVKHMIAEVDTNNSGTINYSEFVDMMLGKKTSVLKLILMFELK